METGKHVMIDAFGCRQGLDDLNAVFRFLADLPEALGMTIIAPPFCFPYEAPDRRESGITGVVIIAESHVTAHTYPEKGYVAVDAFSCKPFLTSAVLQAVFKSFAPEKIVPCSVNRGFSHADERRPVAVCCL